MKFQFYYEKLIDSKEFQKFQKDHKDAYPCSGFFVLDLENSGKTNQVHFDFYSPKEKKMYSFKLHEKVEFIPVENMDARVPEKVALNYDFDLKDFEELIRKKMSEEMINGKIQKILFSFQRLEKKDYLVTTVFLSNLGLLKVNIDIADKKITAFEKKSFFDMLKIVKKKD